MSKTKPKGGASASAAAAHIFVSNVTFARLLNESVIKRQPRDVGYDLGVVRGRGCVTLKEPLPVAAERVPTRSPRSV